MTLAALLSPGRQLIDGAWTDAIDGGRWDVIDPATEEVVANVPFGGAADVNMAIEAAHRELPKWRARTAYDRGAILVRAASLIRERAAELARVTVRESGRPLLDSTREWQIAADLFADADDARAVPANDQQAELLASMHPGACPPGGRPGGDAGSGGCRLAILRGF